MGFGHSRGIPVYNGVLKAAIGYFFMQIGKLRKIAIREISYVATAYGAILLNNGVYLTGKRNGRTARRGRYFLRLVLARAQSQREIQQ